MNFPDIPSGITALVGGGGKTSLLYWLGRRLSRQGPVILTTSTHILRPLDLPLLLNPSPAEVSAALRKNPLLVVGASAEAGKIKSCDSGIPWLNDHANHVLVEADGARKLPLKAPADHEPVLPATTQLVIAVAGLDAIGRPIAETVFRPERYAALVAKDTDELVTPADVAQVLQHAAGQKKDVNSRYLIVLNKADTAERIRAGRAVMALLEEDVCLMALRAPQPLLDFQPRKRLN